MDEKERPGLRDGGKGVGWGMIAILAVVAETRKTTTLNEGISPLEWTGRNINRHGTREAVP